jgi:hypothetical protein
MIKISVQAGKDPERRVHELCEAIKKARIWTVKDRRSTRNLRLIHSSGNVKGTIHRTKSADPAHLDFECRAKDSDQEAITTGRFVNLILRDVPEASELTIRRA